MNQVADFSFVNNMVKDRYNPGFGRQAEDLEFMLWPCLIRYLYGDRDTEVIESAKVNQLTSRSFSNVQTRSASFSIFSDGPYYGDRTHMIGS